MPQMNICLKEFTVYSVIPFSVLVFHCYLIMLNQFLGGARVFVGEWGSGECVQFKVSLFKVCSV